MKFNSLSLAKTAILLSLAIGSISSWFAWKTTQDMPSLKQSVTQANKKAADASAAVAELMELPSAKGELQAIDTALSGFMLELMNSRVRYGVEVTQAAPAKGSTGERTPVEQLADDLPGTKIKSLKVALQGSYSDYERFTAFLDNIRKIGVVSIIHLKVKDNSYALSVRIYGKP